jgi:hypothetical protein
MNRWKDITEEDIKSESGDTLQKFKTIVKFKMLNSVRHYQIGTLSNSI